MKKTKNLLVIVLIILMLNMVAGNLLISLAADNQEENIQTYSNDSSNTINNVLENNTKDTTTNETTNNNIKNDTTNQITNNNINNTTNENTNNSINNTITNSANNTINNSNNTVTNNITSNKVENNTISDNDQNNSAENQSEVQDYSMQNEESAVNFSAKSQEIGVTYRTHVQNEGWQNYVKNSEVAGTSGQGLRLEALNIKLQGSGLNFKIKYQVHVQNIGWQDWKENDAMAGTSGQGLRLEAIKIRLETTDEYSVMYRVHVQNIGWQDWRTDGDIAGTFGQGLRLEAIQIKIVPKVKKGRLYIDTPENNSTCYTTNTIRVAGWKMSNLSNTTIKAYVDNGTPIEGNSIKYTRRDDVINAVVGHGTSIENPNPGFEFSVPVSSLSNGKHTIKVVLYSANSEVIQQCSTTVTVDKNLHVQYQSHVQNVGWQGYSLDGGMAGTSGRGLRVEAMNIKLINAPSNANIIYRAHVQNVGWQGWKSNGQMAGTSGQGLRVEALEIKLQNMDNYTVEYQVHIQDYGWSSWYIDGETAGTVGQGKRIEAIRIRIVSKYKRQYNGIDVSEFNHNINWALVKRSGVEFAMIRVGYRGYGTEGNFKEDANFKINIQDAKRAGVPVGVYFVTQATTRQEAVEEANWVIDKIKGYSLNYPVAIDIERSTKPDGSGRADDLDKDTRTYLASVFCQTIQASGYTPLIYTNVDWATNKLNMSQLSAYDTWIASYKENVQSGPSYSGKYSIWQHTSSGKVDGILGNVDLNICYKKY